MPYAALLFPLLVMTVATVVCATLVLKLVACRRARADMAEQFKTLTNAEKSAVRQLRLASHNLRSIGMTLQGHAEHMEVGGAPDIAGVASTATGVFDIADYMHEWIQHAPSARALNQMTLNLGGLVDEAISSVAHKMEPGRRIWRVEPDVIALRLRADQRALRYVLMRALSVSVRSTGHDEGIRVRREDTPDTVSLVIEHQPGQVEHSSSTVNGGGPDLRLTLARELMEAHGGKFEVIPDDGKRVRVRIAFPVERLCQWSDDTREVSRIVTAPIDTDDREIGVLAD
jgi:hypothetical protein